MERWHRGVAQNEQSTKLLRSIRIRDGRLSILLDLHPPSAVVNDGSKTLYTNSRILGLFLFVIYPHAMLNDLGTCSPHMYSHVCALCFGRSSLYVLIASISSSVLIGYTHGMIEWGFLDSDGDRRDPHVHPATLCP